MTKENEIPECATDQVMISTLLICFKYIAIFETLSHLELTVLRIFLVQHVYSYVFVFFCHRLSVVVAFAIGFNFSNLFILYFFAHAHTKVAPQDVTYNLTQKRSFRVFSEHYL